MKNRIWMKIHWKMAVSATIMVFLFLIGNNHVNAQTYYSPAQSASILKLEIANLESGAGQTKTPVANLLAVKLAYYKAVLNQISLGLLPALAIENNFNLMTAVGVDAEYTGFTPVSKAEANTIKAQAIDLVSE